MNKLTKPTKASDIKREWHLIDAKDKVLGRLTGQIALLLIGKSKPYFTRNLDCGDYVVVINAKDVAVTGRKNKQKKYYRHSGFPGGFKEETLENLRQRKPEDVIRHAVRGMLPQNRLRDKMIKRLLIFPAKEHPYGDKVSAQGGSASGGKS